MAEGLIPSSIEPPDSLYRVGWFDDPLHFSEIDPIPASLPYYIGNRFDVVGSGVMYAATDQTAAYKETISFARPSAKAYAFTNISDEHFMNPGGLPAEWRENRRMVKFRLEHAPRFLDIEHDQTLAFLTKAMSEELLELKISNLDSSLVRSNNRQLTRAIATYAYTAVDADGEALYSGIRYCSRFQSHECWAIFRGVDIVDYSLHAIEKNDRYLLAAARSFDITVH